MKIKSSNVNISNLHPYIKDSLPEIESIFKDTAGTAYEITITSGNDSYHISGSDHYKDRAIDIRSRDLSETEAIAIVNNLKEKLGSDWYIDLESNHFHLSYRGKETRKKLKLLSLIPLSVIGYALWKLFVK